MEQTQSEKPKSAILLSMEQSYRDTNRMLPFILENAPFIVNWSWRSLSDGKIPWEANRTKMKQEHSVDSRTLDSPVRHGLDGYFNVVSETGFEYTVQAIVRYYVKRKGTYKLNCIESFYEEDLLDVHLLKRVKTHFNPFWLVLGCGRTAEHPQYIRAMRVEDLPLDCFHLETSVHSRNDLILNFSGTWVNVDKGTFMHDFRTELREIQRRLPK